METVHITIPATFGYEDIPTNVVETWVTKMGANKEKADKAKLAVMEICLNAIEHGCGNDSNKTVAIDFSQQSDTLKENFGSFGKWQSLPVKRHTTVKLQPSETLIVYTDGLFENANQEGKPFGQENLKQLFLEHQQTDLNTQINTVFQTVYEHCAPEPIEDDETLLVIRKKASTIISSTTD